MRILVLGGTRFLGRAIVDEAVRRGCDVTTFTRGMSGSPRPGAEALHGDRTKPADLEIIRGRDWDAVLDTGQQSPAQIGLTARAVAEHTGHYIYVSSLRVYRDWPTAPVDEESPLRDCSAEAAGDVTYPERKAGAERAVEAAVPGRALFVRAGMILGPHEDLGRLPWWLSRIARGDRFVAPGAPDRPLPVTDARDLAGWALDSARRRIPGAVNVPGSPGTTMEELLAACAASTGSSAEPYWVDDAALLAAGVQPWNELPGRSPPGLYGGVGAEAGERAAMTGMHHRPLTDTVRDTWRWLRHLEHLPTAPHVGLSPVKESALLAQSGK